MLDHDDHLVHESDIGLAWDQAPQWGKRQEQSKPSDGLEREKGWRHPFPSPNYLSACLVRRFFFFFSPTSNFSPFFPNVEPGPRLMLDEPQLDAHPRRPRGS